MTGPPGDLFADLLPLLHPERILADPRATGQGVRVAVIDSGVDRRRLASRCANRGQTMLPVEEALFREGQTEPLADPGQPSNPHGTTVADVLLSLAPRVQLFSADVFGPTGSCDVKVLIRAIRHAMDAWGCQLINLSLGIIEQRLQPVQRRLELLRTIEEAYYRDVLIVAAAHNDHPLTRSYPGVFAPPLLSVGRGDFADPLDFSYELHDQIEFRATVVLTSVRWPRRRPRAGRAAPGRHCRAGCRFTPASSRSRSRPCSTGSPGRVRSRSRRTASVARSEKRAIHSPGRWADRRFAQPSPTADRIARCLVPRSDRESS